MKVSVNKIYNLAYISDFLSHQLQRALNSKPKLHIIIPKVVIGYMNIVVAVVSNTELIPKNGSRMTFLT